MPTLRTLAIPAAILFSATLLAGCGDDAEPATDPSDEMMEETMAPADDSMEDDSMEEDSMEDDSMEDEG
ncbi:hypothetical protein [Demequina aestuarii]|uniref:hypothetical protein n=1 Tax=Demequina aestuarii TaxID=327095 RepID=UPI000785E96C|nr:hypothetical protein [Demequina aestuarii]